MDAYGAERSCSLLLRDIEYLGHITNTSNSVEGSDNVSFIAAAQDDVEGMLNEVRSFHDEVSALQFQY